MDSRAFAAGADRSRCSLRELAGRPHRAVAELAAIVGLYLVYQAGRGAADASYGPALHHAHEIVRLERAAGIFWERGIQQTAGAVPGLMTVLGLAYVTLHLAVTSLFLVWLYRSRPQHFARFRTALVAASAIALVGYFAFPTAPPRLAAVGLADTVESAAHVNLGSGLLTSFYNPFAAVPSLHFTYALLIAFTGFRLAGPRLLRAAAALYPAFVLLMIVATGNHFLLDAAAGALVAATALLVARATVPTPGVERRALFADAASQSKRDRAGTLRS